MNGMTTGIPFKDSMSSRDAFGTVGNSSSPESLANIMFSSSFLIPLEIDTDQLHICSQQYLSYDKEIILDSNDSLLFVKALLTPPKPSTNLLNLLREND